VFFLNFTNYQWRFNFHQFPHYVPTLSKDNPDIETPSLSFKNSLRSAVQDPVLKDVKGPTQLPGDHTAKLQFEISATGMTGYPLSHLKTA
jgi:hypothetical protein